MPLDPATAESPFVLAHSVLEESEVTAANESSAFPISNALDRSRVTLFKANAASAVGISAARKTALLNGFFESSVENWELDDGGGTATFTLNTSSPLTGLGDGELDITVFSATVKLTADQVFTIKKGERWDFAGKFKADAVRTLTLKLLRADGSELHSAAFSLTPVTSFESTSFVNDAVGAVDEYGVTFEFQVGTVATINMDDLRFNIVRLVDTLLIDSFSLPHTLRGATITVSYSPDSFGFTPLITAFVQTDDEIILKRAATPTGALFWLITISAPRNLPEFSQLWLGEGFYFRIRSRVPFAPDEIEMNWKETVTEGGVVRRYPNFDRKRIQFRLPFIDEDTVDPYYPTFVQWIEDTNAWVRPYFLQVEPTSDPRNILFGFTREKRFRARRRPGFRSLNFTFQEQLG